MEEGAGLVAQQAGVPSMEKPQTAEPAPPCLTLDSCSDLQEVRRGRYSVIYRAKCSLVGNVAVKSYDRPSLVPKKQKMATREAIVLKYLNSQGVPNITHMWSAYASQDMFHILMEFCEGGNLLELLKAAGAPATEEWLATTVAAPLLRTLSSMHGVGVTHRDVKLENIFLDGLGQPKLGDFDLAVFHHEAPARAPVGTIFYMAPEVLLLASYKGSPLEVAMQRRVCEKMDVWSLGVCLFELAAGYKPFQGVSYEGIASAIIQHAMADLPGHVSPALRSFLAAALTYDPAQRPSAQQLLDHPWIQVHSPTAVRSDSAGSLMEVHRKQQKLFAASGKPSSCMLARTSAGAAGGRHCKPIPCSSTCGSSADSVTCASSGGSSHCPCSATCCSTSSCGSSAMFKCSRSDACGGGGGVAVAAAGGSGYLGSLCDSQPHSHHHRAPSGSSSTSSGSRMGSLGGFEVCLGGVAAAAGPAVANSWAAHQHRPCQAPGGAAAAGSAVMSPFLAPAVLAPVLRRNSLGTHCDWSTQDSSATCQSPRSMMRGMGLSANSSLARQLLPWASAGSAGLGLNSSASAPGTGTAAGTTPAPSAAAAAVNSSSGGVLGHAGSGSIQQQQMPQQQGFEPPGRCCHVVGTGDNVRQQQPGQIESAPGHHACAGDRSAVASSSMSSMSGQQQQQQQQQQQTHDGTAVGGSRHQRGSSSSGGSAPSTPAAAAAAAASAAACVPPDAAHAQQAAAAAAAAAAASSQQQQVSPLALAVAAAVAEHNKRQPRLWTPFALRVHQLRVAQVLLAERQRQVAQNQANPPPPSQPLVPLQPLRLPALQDDEDETEQQQQQQGGTRQQAAGAAATEQHGLAAVPLQARPHGHAAAADASAGTRVGGGSSEDCQQQQQQGMVPQQQAMPCVRPAEAPPARPSAAAAAPAGGASPVTSPPVHQMQQRVSGVAGTPPGSTSSGGSSSKGVSAGAAGGSKPPKPARKKWLACIVPRAL